jgi:hypothetical protein
MGRSEARLSGIEKGMAAAKECEALESLMWPRDMRDMEYASKLITKQESNEDLQYAYALMGEVAERLREAQDFPEKRERRRWQDVQFAVTVSAGRDPAEMLPFLKSAATDFAAVQPPKDESDLLAVATWTMASLLDVLTSDPEKFAGCGGRLKPSFTRCFPACGAAGS